MELGVIRGVVVCGVCGAKDVCCVRHGGIN